MSAGTHRDLSTLALLRRALPLLPLLLTAGGCCLLAPCRPGPPLSRDEVIEAVRAHAESFHTVTDTDITLLMTTWAEGERRRLPSLGGFIAFNADLPGLWLDTQKVTRRIFSLKALGSQFWLTLFQTQEVVTGGAAAYAKLPHLIRPDEARGFFAGPEWLGLTWPSTEALVEEDNYRFDVYVLGMLRRQVFVDRRKVAIAAIRRYDALGRLVTEIRLEGHTRSGGIEFPRRLIVERPLSGVKVELRLDDPILNKKLPPSTFLPPERPGWRVINLDYEPLSAVQAFRAD